MNRSVVFLIIPVCILFSFGLLMIFNTSSAQELDQVVQVSARYILLKQAGYGMLGVLVGYFVYRAGYERLIYYSFPLFITGTILLVLVFVPHIGQNIHGARRWIHLVGVSFQPSECMKLAIPLVYIRSIVQNPSLDFYAFVRKLAFFSIPLGLILAEPDNGTTAILILLLIVLFFLTKVRASYWVFPLGVMICCGMFAASQMPHVSHRIQVYLHPELDLKGKGHQPYQAKIAAGSGGIWGRGFGQSLQKLNYLPEAKNDYIAAIYAEELGFIGILGLIGLYLSISYAGFLVAMRAKDQEGFLLGSSITFLIAIQAFLNLGIVSGLLPSKGTTLPFFSQGGTSLTINWIFLWILLDIARKKKAYA